MKIKKILVVVELENGTAHQVLTSKEKKEMALQVMKNDKGSLVLDKACEPFTLDYMEDINV